MDEWSQVSQNNHDETMYYVKDSQGSVRSLVNQKNQVRKTYNYDAFGRVIEKNHVNDQGIRSNIYHYGGYIYDYTTSMYFVNNRYYNPELGRWNAKDKLLIDGFNRYRYVMNNPLKFIDPLGLAGEGTGEGGFTLGDVIANNPDSYPYDLNNEGYYLAQQYFLAWYHGTEAYNRLDSQTMSHNSNLAPKLNSIMKDGVDLSKLTVAEMDRMAYDNASLWFKIDSVALAGYMSYTAFLNSKAVNKFITENIDKNFQKNVKDAFASDVRVTTLSDDVKVYRYHGGTSNNTSYWYTPYKTSNPAADLALPKGNTNQHMDSYVIQKGTTILEGTVAQNFGQPGGGYQFYAPNPSVVIP